MNTEAQETGHKQETPKWATWIVLAAVLLLTAFCFSPSLGNGFTNWDDDVYVINNPYLQNWSSQVGEIFSKPIADNYHPLTIISLGIDRGSGPLSAFPFHLHNLFLHLLVCVLIFFLTKRLARGNLWIAGFVTVFFAIHPMRVESVAWISERKDLLYSLFFVAGMMAHLLYLEKKNKLWYAAGLVLFLLSCFSKPAAVVFPLVLFLLDYFEKREWSTAVILEKIPHFAIAIVFGVITIMIQKDTAVGDVADLNILQRLSMSGFGFMTYLIKFFAPTGLSALHPYPDTSKALPIYYTLAPLGMLLVLVVSAFLSKMNRIWLFGMGFFLVNIILVLQFVAVGNAIFAERYTYLAYWGLMFLLISLLFQFGKSKNISPYIFGVPLILVAAVFSIQTMKRCTVWKNGGTLWTDVIAKYPDNKLGYTKRGYYFNSINNMPQAISDFARASTADPNYYGAYAGLGEVSLKSGKFDGAIRAFTEAIRLNPTFNKTVHNRGVAYFNKAKAEKNADNTEEINKLFQLALTDLNKAGEMDPSFLPTKFSKSKVLWAMGDYEGAIVEASAAISQAPNSPQALENRANLHYEKGNAVYAAKDPASARQYYEKARKDVDKVIRSGAPLPVSYNIRALINHLTGDYEAALKDYDQAIKLDPDFTDALSNRDVLLKSMGGQ